MNLIIISPCFNEADALPALMRKVREAIDAAMNRFDISRVHIVLIDDGSVDTTWEVMQEIGEQSFAPVEISALRLSRNFGHQAAICAGLDYAYTAISCAPEDTIIVMDSDGQHPPAMINQLLAARAEGYQHVQMLHQNSQGGFVKRLTSPLFYRVFRFFSGLSIPAGASDFRAFSGLFLRQYLKFNESTRFNRGIFHWLGFKTKYIHYTLDERAGGRSSYTLFRMIKLALTGLTYFSSKPLTFTIAAIVGFGFLTSAIYGLIELGRVIGGARFAPGWVTIMFVVSLWGALIALSQLLIALYVARIFEEVKRRPSYIVERHVRFSHEKENVRDLAV